MATKYESVKQIPREERDAIYDAIRADIAPIVAKYGEPVVRWALNKYNSEEQKKAKLRKQIKDAQDELKDLE